MTTITLALAFKAWRRFHAEGGDYHRFLVELARESKSAFIAGINSGKSGRKYSHLPRRSSAPGEYPASQSGALKGSISTRVREHEMTIGTSTPYSNYLRYGTSKMAARKMSDDALEDGLARMRKKYPLEAHWVRG